MLVLGLHMQGWKERLRETILLYSGLVLLQDLVVDLFCSLFVWCS